MDALELDTEGQVTSVTMNRPDVRNAFNDDLIAELLAVFKAPPSPILVLRGAGSVFSAGADLAWMKRSAELSVAENRREAERLAAFFQVVDQTDAVVVASVQGAAIGGGVGLVSVADMVVAESEAVFGFTEVRLGLIPAVISPFALSKIGQAAARRYFITGERFNAAEAHRIGLVHKVVAAEELSVATERVVQELSKAGPEAMLESKRLIRLVAGTSSVRDVRQRTAGLIAERRASDEGQEGLSAFLEKRKPRWLS